MIARADLGPLSADATEALGVAVDMLAEHDDRPTAHKLARWCEERMVGGRLELPMPGRSAAAAELRAAIVHAALLAAGEVVL